MISGTVVAKNSQMLVEATSQNVNKIHITENQEKVIRDKYLKDDKTVEIWLHRVAKNIALAEFMFDSVGKQRALEGVNHKIHQDQNASDLTLLHEGLHGFEERELNFKIFIKNLYAMYEGLSFEVREIEHKFYELMSSFKFLPNSPTLMNAGRDLQQLSACYVLPVPDSIEGIFRAIKNTALIHKSGGGTGFSFGKLRPSDDFVRSTHGVASGPLSFMAIFDVATEKVKQGGTRRGANMAILPYWHPDIISFIKMKKEPNNKVMENFNISVGIDAEFMTAVKNNEKVNLINPNTGKPVKEINAAEIFDLMAESAWFCGDPGYVVLDRINASDSNTTPALGQITATNPCGEQPLGDNEPCNLGSLNLSRFISTGANGENFINKHELKEAVYTATRFLDNVIEVNNYPTPEIERMAKGNRRIGLGIMGLAETLVALNLPYDSPKAIKFSDQLMQDINGWAREASVELGSVRGTFPNWTNSVFDPTSTYFRGEELKPRNCARTTIAPTGTIAIAAGLQGSGIEPFFAIGYTRYNAKGLDAIKGGKTPDKDDTFFEVNPQFKAIAEKHGYFGLKEDELWGKIANNHNSVKGVSEIPANIQDLFVTSHDIDFEDHIKMQVAFQNHTNNGVSKTINCKNDVTVEDIKHAYRLAYDLGVKGLTIYRDGSKSHQVLNLGVATKPVSPNKRFNGGGNNSVYYEKQTGYGQMHVNIVHDDDGPFRIFVNLPPLGTEISGLASVLGILLSKYLENGGDPEKILKHLNSIKGDKPIGFGPNRVESIPHGLSQVLRDHLQKSGHIKSNGVNGSPAEGEHCPQCYSANVGYVNGCKDPTCFDCGYSRCS